MRADETGKTTSKGKNTIPQKELKRLKRSELLEVMLDQAREIDSLQQLLQEARKELQTREIILTEAGSIAEAALRLNHIFECAQQAADQYLEQVRKMTEQQETTHE